MSGLKSLLSTFILCSISLSAFTQQTVDKAFTVPSFTPMYESGKGTRVYVDQGHFNFHTLDGQYRPFGSVLEKDGYDPQPIDTRFTASTLSNVRILVIANAMQGASNWELPTRSAFDDEEIIALRDWVDKGGSLFLIADHMPAAGAAAKLAICFGFNFINGDLYNSETHADIDIFSKENQTLLESPITTGVDSVATFHGQAFMIPEKAEKILGIGEGYVIYLPSEIGKINGAKTPKFYAQGLSQGAYMNYGKGRLAVFGEAGMFTAQLTTDGNMGMNNENASQNYMLLLNVIHWLDGQL